MAQDQVTHYAICDLSGSGLLRLMVGFFARTLQKVYSRLIPPRSYWILGSYVTSNSMSAPSNALPRFRTL
jgi:hypothetical protein